MVRRRLDADDRLDAEVQVGGRLGANEAVVMRMYGRLSLHAESVVLPLLASDAPVVTWWHGEPPERLAYDALGVLASRRVTDCASAATTAMVALQPAGQGLRTGRHRPGLDPHHPVALAARLGVRRRMPTADLGRGADRDAATPSAALIAGWLQRGSASGYAA